MKWCSHCRKVDHNDSECHSTRMVTGEPDAGPIPSGFDLTPEHAWQWGFQTGYRTAKGEGLKWAEAAADARFAALVEQSAIPQAKG